MNLQFKQNLQGITFWGTYLTLISCLYYASIHWLIKVDWVREDYNYCYLIPFVIIYLVWEKKDFLSKTPSHFSAFGFFPFTLGVLLYVLGELGGEFFTIYISLWCLAIGILWIHMGYQKIKVLAFPIFFSLTMFPLPHFIYGKISFYMKLISSWIGVAFLQVYGLPAYREGNVIDLGFVQLQVVDACSGLRYLVPLCILGLLIAYFYRSHLWKRIFLVISVFPLAIITNSIRIALTGVIYKHFGADVAEGFFHGFSGWLIFTFSFGVLMLEIWVFKYLPPFEPRISSSARTSNKLDLIKNPEITTTNSQHLTDLKSKTRFFPAHFIIAAFILSVITILFTENEFREKTPVKKSFDLFPLVLGTWEGKREALSTEIVNSLDLTDYTIINFSDNANHGVNLYVAYYESQRKGESIHSPSTCIPGSGWDFKDIGIKQIALVEDQSINVKQAFIQKNNNKQLVYYWFPQRGRILTNPFQLKLYTLWDALTKQRTDGALVRLITPIGDDEMMTDAEKRLHLFTQKLMPVLDEFIPG